MVVSYILDEIIIILNKRRESVAMANALVPSCGRSPPDGAACWATSREHQPFGKIFAAKDWATILPF